MRNLSDKFGEKLLDIATKTGLGAAKTASKNVVTGELPGNKIAKKNVKLKSVPDESSRNVEAIVI